MENALGHQKINLSKQTSILTRVALAATLLNFLLAVFKYLLGRYTGSLALCADALHSFTDVISSLSVYLGLKFAERKTKSFPYGLYKLENLVALLTSVFIFLAALEILHQAFHGQNIIIPRRVPVTVVIFSLMTLVMWLFSRWELKMAQKSGSPSLAADAQHITTDILATIIILIGLVGGAFGIHFVDRLAALFVAVLIFKIGLEIAGEALKVLLDASLEPEIFARITDIIRAFPEVVEIKSLTGRRSGRFCFVEAEIVVDVSSLEEAHELVTYIEEEIYDAFPEIDRVIIHFEPPKLRRYLLAIPTENKGEKVSEHFGCAPEFYLWEIECEPAARVKSQRLLPNPYVKEDKRRGVKVVEWLAKEGVEAVLISKQEVRERGFIYALLAHGIRPIFCPQASLEALKQAPPCPPFSLVTLPSIGQDDTRVFA